MRWRLILEEFGPDIQYVRGEDNIVADVISRLPTANEDQNEPNTEVQGLKSEILSEMEVHVLEDDIAFPLDLSLVQRTQNIELNQRNSKLRQLIDDAKSGYGVSTLDGVKIVVFNDKIYVPVALRQRTMNWYHFYLNHPGGERLYKTLAQVCYWKGMINKCNIFCQKCDICQKYKSRKRKYGHLPPKNVGILVPWQTVHTDLIGPYTISTKQFQPDGSIEDVELHLTCMTMLDPATGWFEVAEVSN
jgi:hypothetical protein